MSTINEKEQDVPETIDTPCAEMTEEPLEDTVAETAIPLGGNCLEDTNENDAAPLTVVPEAPLAVLVTEEVCDDTDKKKDKKKKKKAQKKSKKKDKKAKKKDKKKAAKKAKKEKKDKKNKKKNDKKKK